MKLAIASDHRGYKLKKYIIKHMKDIEFIDLGSNDDKPSDYSEYGIKLGEYIVKNSIKGIAICGSGIGISIACNKVKGVRCGRVCSIKDTIATRKDNDANVIAFSAEINKERAIRMIEEFINTSFENEERHLRRINIISKYENN